MTVTKLIASLSKVPPDWPVVLQTPDGFAEVRRFSRREITVEGDGTNEDQVIKLLVIGA
jgi:hypothetical protein